MGPSNVGRIRYPRQLFNDKILFATFNGSLPGVGKDGVNPTTTAGTTSSTSEGNGTFNPPPTDVHDINTSTTTSSQTASSLTSTSTTVSSVPISSTHVTQSQTSVAAALFASSTTSTTSPGLSSSPSAGSNQSNSTVSTTATAFSIQVSTVVAPLSPATSTGDPSPTSISNSSKHPSSPGIIVGAVLGAIVLASCLLAVVLCCSRLRRRHTSQESPARRPRLAVDTQSLSTVALSSPFSLAPYDYQSPSTMNSRYFSPAQNESGYLPNHDVRRNKRLTGRTTPSPYSARDAIRSVQRAVHRSHRSPSYRTTEPEPVSWRESRTPLLDTTVVQGMAPAYASSNPNFSPESMYTASPLLTGPSYFTDSPFSPSEKARDSMGPPSSIPQTSDESVTPNDTGPSEFIPDDDEVHSLSDPPPAYDV